MADRKETGASNGARGNQDKNKDKTEALEQERQAEEMVMLRKSVPHKLESLSRFCGQLVDVWDADEIKIKASSGSITAAKLLKALKACESIVRVILRGREIEGVDWKPSQTEIKELMENVYVVSTCPLSRQVVQFMPRVRLEIDYILCSLMTEIEEAEDRNQPLSEFETKVKLCFVLFSSISSDELKIHFLTDAIKNYPDDVNLLKFLMEVYANKKDMQSKALDLARKSLERFHNDPDFLLCVAANMTMTFAKIDKEMLEARKEFEKFIQVAPYHHPRLPNAYYCISFSYMSFGDDLTFEDQSLVTNFYKMGLAAEERLLSCFRPYHTDCKQNLENILKADQDLVSTIKEAFERFNITRPWVPTVPNKIFLLDPKRMEIIREHRRGNEKRFSKLSALPPKQKGDPSQVIMLKEIDLGTSRVYSNRVLSLLIIEEPNLETSLTDQPDELSLSIIAEGEDGVAVPVRIEEVPVLDIGKFDVGRRIDLLNPCLLVSNSEDGLLSMSEFYASFKGGVRFHKDCHAVKNMCRFCGLDGARQTCAKCMKAKYCNRECQQADWKILKHKLVCVSNSSYKK